MFPSCPDAPEYTHPTPISAVANAAAAALAATSDVYSGNDWDDEVRQAETLRVTVLLDPRDDAAMTSALLVAHGPAAGRVTVHPIDGRAERAGPRRARRTRTAGDPAGR